MGGMNLRQLLMAVGVGTLIISCSKEEASTIDSSQQAATIAVVEHFSVNPPYNQGDPGVDPAVVVELPNDEGEYEEGLEYPYSEIPTPTSAYKRETCLLDISKLEDHKTYHGVADQKLSIGFFYEGGFEARVLKLSSGPTGWNSPWGSASFVESETPDVLYLNRDGYILLRIQLSKPCIEFGFEMAPNHQDYNHSIFLNYGDWYTRSLIGSVGSVVRSPSGARLYALKATEPFTTLTIVLDDSPTGSKPMEGFAMANIRYKLAK